MKKVLFNILSVVLIILVFNGCKESENDDNGNLAPIVGKWSINTQEFTLKNTAGTTIEEAVNSYGVNMFTFEFKSDGTVLVISVEEAFWFAGTYVFNENTGELTLTILGDAIEGTVQSVTSTSITIFITDTYTDDGQTVTEENVFTGTLNGSSVPIITDSDLKSKWSIKDMELKIFADVDDDDEFDPDDELYQMIEIANIPHNRNTVEFLEDDDLLSIDAYIEGEWSLQSWYFLDNANIIIEDEDDQSLLHLISISGNDYVFMLISFSYEEIESSFYYTKNVGTVTVIKNNGTEPAITESIFHGSWELTSFTEFENGEEVEGEGGVPIGTIITFNSNGTGTLAAGTDEFELTNVALVDPSNIYFEFDSGDEYNEVLLNINSYNPATETLAGIVGEIDEEYDPVLEENVVVQKESHITLVKQ